MSRVEMFKACNLCGLNSISSGSESRIFLCDKEQMAIFDFLQCKAHGNDGNDNDNSSRYNSDGEKDGSCIEVVMCSVCIKRIEIISAMRKQVKFEANAPKLIYRMSHTRVHAFSGVGNCE